MCKCAHVWLLFRQLSKYSIHHYYRSNFYWCNIISCSRMRTDLMWINRHSIIIGLQSHEHDAESNFNDAVFFYPRFTSEHTFSLYPVSCIPLFLLCVCTYFVWCISLWFYWISLLLQFKSHVKRVLKFCFGGTHHTADDTTEKKIYRQIETGN